MNTTPPKAEELVEAALRLRTETERKDYIAAMCEGHPALLVTVEALLEARMRAPAPGDGATTVALPRMETQGETIGRYRLLQTLGEGGFGVVWEAEQREPVRRRVALKIIKLGMDTREVVARFEAERQALALMDHPNIARVLDGGATDTGRPYFVMEMVGGVPLTQYCDAHKLNVKERLELFIPICQAVQHAHQKGVIHRDLKPSNILVAMVDGKPVPKIIDFGIARATSQQLTEKTLFTQVGQLIGTPEYMSPEQAGLGGIDVDTRTDVYSLGVVLYELLTGQTPLDRDRLRRAAFAEIQRMVCDEEPPRPSTRVTTLGEKITDIAARRHIEPEKLGRALRGDLDWIVMRALEKDRTRRYDTANGLALDIQRYLDNEPVTAGPPSMGYRVGKFIARNRAGVTAAAALALILVAATAVSAWQAARAMRAQKEAETARGDAEDLIAYMLTDLKDNLAPVGRVDLMRGIGDTVMRYYARGGRAEGGSGSLLRHGQALGVLAAVAENTGSAAEADKLNGRCLELLEKWIADHGRGAEAIRSLAEACERQSLFLRSGRWGREGDANRSAAFLDRALALLRELQGLPGRTDDDRSRLVLVLLRKEQMLRQGDKKEEAAAILREAAALLVEDERRAELAPSDQLTKAFLLCEAFWLRMRPDDLPEEWARLVRLPTLSRMKPVRDVLEKYPDNQQLREQVWRFLSWSTIEVKFYGKDGIQGFAADISAELMALDPNNMLWAERAARSSAHLAFTLVHSGRKADAAPYYERAIEILENLVRRQPANIALKEQLGSAYRNQGFSLLDRREPARKSFARALEVVEELKKLGYTREAEEQLVWLNIFMSQVMPTVDEQVRLLDDVAPIAEKRAAADPLAFYYVQGEAIRYYESARRYPEALRKADAAIKAIETVRRRTGDPDDLRWHWREAHQSRARILHALDRDKEALSDIGTALEIADDDLRKHSIASRTTRLEKMTALCGALVTRLQIKPSPNGRECDEIIKNMELIVAGLKQTEADASESGKALDYLLEAGRLLVAAAEREKLEAVPGRTWDLLLEGYNVAALAARADRSAREDIQKRKAALLIDDAGFMNHAREQGRWLGLLQAEIKLWREQCDKAPNDPDAWLYQGQYLLAAATAAKSDTAEARSALRKATDLWLAAKVDLSEGRIRSLRRLASTWTELSDSEQTILVHREWIRCSKLTQGADDRATVSAIASFISAMKRLGRTSEALASTEELLALRRRLNGPESREVAVSLREAGALHAAQNSPDIARKLLAESVAILRKAGDAEPLELAGTLIELARLEKTAGNWESAIKLQREALDLRRKRLPEDHADVSSLTADLSATLWSSGTHKEEGLRLREGLLDRKRRQSGPGPPTWLDWLYEYASWKRTEKDYARAEVCARETLEGYSRHFASDYRPFKARKLLGAVLSAQGKHAEAEQQLAAAFEGLAGMASTLPSNQRTELASSMNFLVDHLRTSPGPPDRLAKWAARAHELLLAGKNESAPIPADAVGRLGSLWAEMGQHDKAIAVQRRRVELAKKTPGDARVETAAALIELARALNRGKRLEEAYAAYREAVEIRRAIPAPNYVDGTLHELGLVANSLQKRDEAVQLLKESLDLRRKAGKPALLQAANVESDLGWIHRDKGDLETAIAHYRRALEIRERELGPNHNDVAAVLAELTRVLKMADKPDEALATIERLVKLRKANPGNDGPRWIRHLDEYYLLLLGLKRYPEAEAACREALALNERHFPNRWEPLRSRSYLGYCLVMQRKFDEAEQQLLAAYEGLKALEAGLSPDQRKDIGIVLDRLVHLYKAWQRPDKESEWVSRQKATAGPPKL